MNTYCTVQTKSGHIALVARDGKLTHSSLPKRTRDEALGAVRVELDHTYVEDVSPLGDLPRMLAAYFEGEPIDFSGVPVEIGELGPFHRAAQLAAMRIPHGTLVTYADLAKMAGVPGAARAAGSAMARNNIPIIIPCHRVVASGGRIGGFSSGLEWKRALLAIEGVEL